MEHNLMQHRFDTEGEIDGMRCPIQSYICRKCGYIIEVPDGVNPLDYQLPVCKKSNDLVTVEKKKWICPNKKDYPARKGAKNGNYLSV